MLIKKIVITGGPCAGKTTAMSWVHKAFEERGYKVLFIHETATELITGGITPWDCGSVMDYQRCQMQLHYWKELLIERAARTMNADKVLIVSDRGLMDNKAYMDAGEFYALVDELGTDEVHMRDDYDAVFHLVTAADGAMDYYTMANNSARTEAPEQAVELDRKLIAAWTGNPHFRVIDNSTGFEGKMKRLIREIAYFLGEPEIYEFRHRLLIEFPDTDWLEAQPDCQRTEITQTYLYAGKDREVRIRRSGSDGHYVYYETVKRRVGSSSERIETERRLSEREYNELLDNSDSSLGSISKVRYFFVYESRYFKVDIYPFWNDRAIAEIELADKDQDFRLPERFRVIKEVTDDEDYNISALAVNKGKHTEDQS